MTEEHALPTPNARPAQAIRGLVRGAVVLFLLGAAALAWTFWRKGADPTPSPAPLTQTAAPSPPAAPAALEPFSLSVAEARMAALEARLTEAERRAATAKADASRAERLLVLISVRRAADQGLPLGYLESLLQARFGDTAPRDVAMVITGARQPVTLAQLNEGLTALQLSLSTPSTQSGFIDAVLEDLQGLAVIRRANAPSNAPAHKLARVHQAMARDRVDLAIKDVATMPGAANARDWLGRARRYVAVREALTRLEAATLLTEAPSPAG